MTLQTALRDTFTDPISLEVMTDPVMNSCGHSFERSQINGWMAREVENKPVPECPLCRKPIRNLIPNILLRDALAVLADPANTSLTRVEELTDEERDQVQAAINNVFAQRARDEENGIPTRLEKPEKFLSKIAHDVSRFYCK